MSRLPRVIWTVSDGRRGIDNQALGLAQALARQNPNPNSGQNPNPNSNQIIRKMIGSDPGFARLPPSLQLLKRRQPAQYGLAAPYGDIIIGCGRQAIAPLRSVKKAHPQSFVIYIQDPRGSYTHFDLIIAPEHDELDRPNALSMIGSPNLITPATLRVARAQFAKPLAVYSAPYAALLIGGPSKQRRITPQITAQHLEAAQSLLADNYSLLITLSRRSDAASRRAWMQLAQAHPDKIWFYDGAPNGPNNENEAAPNPYLAFLAAADVICVTEESTNMLTEACASGKAVFRLPMAGAPGKFQTLYDSLAPRCHLRPFQVPFDAPAYAPLFETDRIAARVEARYQDFIKATA